MTAENKVAIITGASQGIGAGLVQGFRAKGYRVLANSRGITPAFAKGDEGIVTVAGDIGDPRTADRILQTAMAQFGRVDTLVNNAGIFFSKPFTDFTLQDYETMQSVNVAGFWHVSQRVAAQMLRQGNGNMGSGHIVSITTSLVDMPVAGVPAALTALTKGGLNAVTQALAIEYAGRGLRVNAVSPGIIDTPMHTPDSHEFLAAMHPIRRLGKVEEIVEAVLYLEGAQFVTGEVLHVDGGVQAGRW
ncbi:SDR family oxidoreductase [Ferrovibrio sp.]|uniref:SDR family NAD(P)-dependent oxidoreductase n=1 Tax=Ferrovibrio sp. TaxID=1917215 RepID=UPI000CB2B0C2|nr:SDR family oxidoreductase [Ferrovibrio sp.]PJI40430.1 MAG: 3-oxoacyl-ACP reductase [Ferrovibrio sp.]